MKLLATLPLLLLFMLQRMGTRIYQFCEKHLIAEDPRPFAKESTSDLILIYVVSEDDRILVELNDRMALGLMNEQETAEFLEVLRIKYHK